MKGVWRGVWKRSSRTSTRASGSRVASRRTLSAPFSCNKYPPSVPRMAASLLRLFILALTAVSGRTLGHPPLGAVYSRTMHFPVIGQQTVVSCTHATVTQLFPRSPDARSPLPCKIRSNFLSSPLIVRS